MRANEIGHHIAKLRQMRGWSQDCMATKIQCLPDGQFYEMTRQMLGNIEARRTRASDWQIRAIREVLGCSYEEIFQGPKTDPPKSAARPVSVRPTFSRPFSARPIHTRPATS